MPLRAAAPQRGRISRIRPHASHLLTASIMLSLASLAAICLHLDAVAFILRPLSPRSTSRVQQRADAPTCLIAGRSPQRLVSDGQRLVREVLDVATSVGLGTGVSRSFQGAMAALVTAAEIAQDPPTSLDDAFFAKTLRKLFEQLGATYVKLGQFIASSPTLFPAVYVREFQRCLSNTTTIPFVQVRRIIQDELGLPLMKVFSHIETEPLASASIAQVHLATLVTGEKVVIKVQKPGLDEVLKTDLSFVYLSARILEFINPDLNIRGSLADIAADLRESMLGELDFRQELRNLVTFRTFLETNNLTGKAVAPMPYPLYSTKRVLTMEYLKGVALTDLDGIRTYSSNPESTLVDALNVWALSVQGCEFFHADVHAGNLLVLEDGRVGFIDFGIVGRLPSEMSVAIDDLNVALSNGSSLGVARALMAMGATIGKVDEAAFAKDIEKLMARIFDGVSKNETSVAGGKVDESQIQDLVLDIAQIAGNNGLKLPREFGLLIKQSLYFDRYTKLLAPDLNMMNDPRIAGLSGRVEKMEQPGEEAEALEK